MCNLPENSARMNRGATRLVFPQVPRQLFVDANRKDDYQVFNLEIEYQGVDSWDGCVLAEQTPGAATHPLLCRPRHVPRPRALRSLPRSRAGLGPEAAVEGHVPRAHR